MESYKTSKEINQKLQYYSRDERAGFNFGKAICVLSESLGINEVEFLRGVLKQVKSRLNYLTISNQDGK